MPGLGVEVSLDAVINQGYKTRCNDDTMRSDLCVQTAVAVSVHCGNKDCSVCKVSVNVQAKAKPLTSVSVLLIKNGLD